jgi:splicing factor 3B subunit 4
LVFNEMMNLTSAKQVMSLMLPRARQPTNCQQISQSALSFFPALKGSDKEKENMASLAVVEHRNQDATVYVGNLDASCTEELLTELFMQVGRVRSVYMPKDKLTGQHNGYGFVEFLDITDADYAMTVLNMIKLYGRPLRVSKSALQDDNSRDVGANLFVGNLDPDSVDEQILHDTFAAFGVLIRPVNIPRDEETGQGKGYAFVSYDSFQSADTAIECMSGQYLGNRQITVQYALKKDAEGRTTNERHGTRVERMLAEALQQHQTGPARGGGPVSFPPNVRFATSTATAGGPLPPMGSVPPPPPPPLPTAATGEFL